MNELLNAIGHDLAQHLASIGIGSGALFFVFVNCMPAKPPASMQDYWTWVRESLQTLTPARYHVNPTLPDSNPAQPK